MHCPYMCYGSNASEEIKVTAVLVPSTRIPILPIHVSYAVLDRQAAMNSKITEHIETSIICKNRPRTSVVLIIKPEVLRRQSRQTLPKMVPIHKPPSI